MRKLFIKDVSKVAYFGGRCRKYGYYHFIFFLWTIQEYKKKNNKKNKINREKRSENYTQPSRVYVFVAIESYEKEEDWK